MKNKIKIISFIFLLTALILFIPSISKAAQYNSDAEVPINYTIKINKIDSADNKNLKGAIFCLKDTEGNIIARQTTDEQGVLSFGNLKTYGSGTDIYYIEEVRTPKGYILDEKETIEVNVQKTVTNVETGGYKLKITCQTLNYETDITRYDFVPVSTVEQLKDIGSGAEYTFEGKTYKYTANTNYKLMNDIDLKGINWKPIEIPVSGIFDGNGHSIKNLTITSDEEFDYKEIGLFKVYSGIVSDLKMENVNISVPGYTKLATSISGKSGVGAFAGFMGSGTFKNCTVSGTIKSSVDNVGGLVGHSAENIIIKFQNCTNYANIIANNSNIYNIGGLIGCALCSLSVNDCKNEGVINGSGSNVGGLVGYVKSQGYEEKAIKAGYAEDGNIITLLIGNSRTEGEYDLYLEDYDLRSLDILSGGVFTVYDSTLEPIEGFENIALEEGRLKIGTVNIKFEGKDTYFIKDVTPVEGYRKIEGYIKVVVTRYWDFETGKFRVAVEKKLIAEDKIDDEIGNNTNSDLDSVTDTFAPEISFENVGWNNAKAVFVNCTNNATTTGYRDIAGIVGSAHVRTTIENCTNNADVTGNGYGKAAGMVAELYCWGKGDYCEIANCNNYGKISSNTNSTGSSAGMAAQVISNIRVTNCVNEGVIYSTGPSGAGGILCDATGMIYVDRCINSGSISTNYNGVDSEAGGIIGKNMTKVYAEDIGISGNTISKNENHVTITNCKNTGNINSTSHMGGIIGYTEGGELTISECNVYSAIADKKVEINDQMAGDKGGIAGYINAPVVNISNCKVENADIKRVSNLVNNTYGPTAGIVGNWCCYGNLSNTLQYMGIKNCEVNNSYLHTKSQSTAGIVGGTINNSVSGVIEIANCNVNDCEIINDEATNTYTSVAGILAMSYQLNNIQIAECNVNNTSVTLGAHGNTSDANAAGILALANYPDIVTISKCNVKSSSVDNNAGHNDGCTTTAGIIAHTSGKSSSSSNLVISECNVEDTDIYTNDADCTGVMAVGVNYKNIITSKTTVKDCDILSKSVQSTSSMMSGMISYINSPLTMSDCTVDNITLTLDTPTPAGGTNIAGFLGCSGYGSNDIIFNNCDIKNSEFTSPGAYSSSSGTGLSNVAGIAGYIAGKATFNGCDVYNNKFIGTNVGDGAPATANVAGILGCDNNNAEINKCTVKKCELSTKATTISNGGNCTLAGMVGVGSNVDIKNSIVEDCDLTGGVMCTGGVVGCAYSSAKFSDVTAKDITILDRGINSARYGTALRSIGGIIGNTYSLTASDMEVTGLNIDSEAISIGGMIGNVGDVKKLTSSSVKDITITNRENTAKYGNYGTVAGIAGNIYISTAESEISDCTVKDATLTGDYDTVAGLFGVVNNSTSISSCTISECTVDNLTAKNNNTLSGAGTGHTGGLIGISTNSTNSTGTTSSTSPELIINESTVKNSNLTIQSGTGSGKHLGGLIGICGNTTLNGCKVISTKVDNNITGGNAGGMVGQVDKGTKYVRTLTVNNPSVTGSTTVITSVNHAGGIVGCGTIIAKGATVTDASITSESGSNGAGGIVGITENNSSIKDVTISGITVSSNQHAAGVAAVMKGTVSNATISEVDIEATTTGEAGAVAGVLEGSLSQATIDKANISSQAGDVGGAVGATTGSVSKVTVTNSTIKSTKIIGGVVGAGLNGSTTLTELTVDDETANAIDAETNCSFKGKYIGAPSIYEEDNNENSNGISEGSEDEEDQSEDEVNGANQISNANELKQTNANKSLINNDDANDKKNKEENETDTKEENDKTDTNEENKQSEPEETDKVDSEKGNNEVGTEGENDEKDIEEKNSETDIEEKNDEENTEKENDEIKTEEENIKTNAKENDKIDAEEENKKTSNSEEAE